MTNNRTQSIGASDAYRAISMDTALWAEKCGLADPPDLDEVEAVQWGNILEATIAATFAERTGRKVEHNRNADVTSHPDHDFLTATLDAIQIDPVRGIGALECKNVGEYLSSDWKESPPLKFQVQLQHQLAVTGMPWGSLCALIGGNRLRWFDMNRNERFIERMIDKEAYFWTHVLDRIPPPVDGTLATENALKRLYATVDGATVMLPKFIDDPNGEPMDWDVELLSAKATIKQNEEKRRWIENHLRAAMKTAEVGCVEGGATYTLKATTRHNPAREASTSTFRVLRRRGKSN